MRRSKAPCACRRDGGVRQDDFWSLLSMVRSASKERVAKPEIAVMHGGEKPCEMRLQWESGSPGLSQWVEANSQGKYDATWEQSQFTAS